MIQTINFSDFVDAFAKMGRKDQYSYEGKKAIFDYLSEVEESQDEPMELDVIAICCDFSEYENLEAVKKEYDNIETREDLEDHTTVLDTDSGSLVIQQF